MSTSIISNISAFLSGNNSTSLTPLQLHLLNGWNPNTLLSYNSAVIKFLKFYSGTKGTAFNLPATENEIYEFCITVGRTEFKEYDDEISARTLSKYLFGLQAWHLFHQVDYPHGSKSVVKVLLKSSEYSDALRPKKLEKPAVMIHHLLALVHSLDGTSNKDEAILDCIIVAFWGMARLAELTYEKADEQPSWITSVLCKDAVRPTTSLSHIFLLVRGAKTARPGECQPILLNAQPNKICPVKAVLRRVTTCNSDTDSLFGYQKPDGQRVNLTRPTVVNRCQQIWREHGWNTISGHSFRVGGASLRAALGVDHEDIKSLGRWTSSCYKLYLRDYTQEELSTTISVLRILNGTTDEHPA